MQTLLLLYVKSRNLFVDNFFVNINYIFKDETIYDLNKYYLKYIFNLTPFILINYIANKLNYKIIYNKDDMFYVTDIKKNNIIPYVERIKIYSSESISDLTDQFQLYNNSLPLWAFLKLNNIKNYDYIEITYMQKGNMVIKKIEKNNNMRIYEMFH